MLAAIYLLFAFLFDSVKITESGVLPVGYCKTYTTEAEAWKTAVALGCQIEAVGDLYYLLHMANN